LDFVGWEFLPSQTDRRKSLALDSFRQFLDLRPGIGPWIPQRHRQPIGMGEYDILARWRLFIVSVVLPDLGHTRHQKTPTRIKT
jgi:hypothetical protein